MEDTNMRETFYKQLSKKRQSNNSSQLSAEKYRKMIEEVQRAKTGKKESRHYWLLKHYDVITVDEVDKLIFPKINNKILYYTKIEELFDILYETHESVGHGGRDRMQKVLQQRYKNITRRDIQTFINICQSCSQKRKTEKMVDKKIEKKGEKPLHSRFRSRCQVDLIDFQSKADGDYKFIMVYKDYLTKYTILRALKSSKAEEVANQLLDIFLLFGAPMILQSNNKREFCNKILDELKLLWPDLKILLGKPSNSQSQSNMKLANRDIENMLTTWMQEHECENWSKSLGFVQFMKNQMLNSINKSPYEAMFNQPPKIGLASSTLSKDIIQDINTEEDLDRILENEMVQEEYTSEQEEDADIWQDSLLEEENEEAQKQETALSDHESEFELNSNNIENRKCDMCGKEVSSPENDLCPSCDMIIERVKDQTKRMKFSDILPPEVQLDVEDEELAFVEDEELTSENSKQLRPAFVKCHCKTDCNTKMCMCVKMKLLCTTKCHSVLACCNCN